MRAALCDLLTAPGAHAGMLSVSWDVATDLRWFLGFWVFDPRKSPASQEMSRLHHRQKCFKALKESLLKPISPQHNPSCFHFCVALQLYCNGRAEPLQTPLCFLLPQHMELSPTPAPGSPLGWGRGPWPWPAAHTQRDGGTQLPCHQGSGGPQRCLPRPLGPGGGAKTHSEISPRCLLFKSLILQCC